MNRLNFIIHTAMILVYKAKANFKISLTVHIRGRPFDNRGGGVEVNVPEHFIYFFQEQRNFFI